MQDSYSKSNKDSHTNLRLSELSDDQVFRFLKRYYNEISSTSEDTSKTKSTGIYFETIETLERLNRCLVGISYFLGYAKVDWDDASRGQNKNKINEIVDFYNDLIIDVDLMKVGMSGYDFDPKVRAFIHFVDSVENCRFRSNMKTNLWTTDNFPHDAIFKTIDQFKQYFEERKKIYRSTFNSPEWKGEAKEVEKAISQFKRINQALYVIKFSARDLSEEDLAGLTSDPSSNPYLASRPPSQKLRDFIEWFSSQHIVGNLPWICTWTKVEIDIHKQVRFTIGMVLDDSDQTLSPKQIKSELIGDITRRMKGHWFKPFIIFDVVQLDQIFDHLGVGVIRNIKLPSKRKVDLMLKWYLGVFYQVDAIIQPSNLEAETCFADSRVIQNINYRKLENIKGEQGRKAKLRTGGTAKPQLNWNPFKTIRLH
ncbi:hypothetical protein [Acinetobacter faecalis]|uniref:hypothetical protein n=1 Tax=Acinetobacter faecalis TaxID=2665161 RepID=UPI002A91EB9E|nr:hypothetical protein [Acinetobacter faecalis]MDY6457175.1 hypothetical protein [Acinetobacter faecalis]